MTDDTFRPILVYRVVDELKEIAPNLSAHILHTAAVYGADSPYCDYVLTECERTLCYLVKYCQASGVECDKSKACLVAVRTLLDADGSDDGTT